MSPELARKVLSSLHGLAEANWSDFTRDARLCAAYKADLQAGRFKYTDDIVTCGRLDCWSTYKDLRARYRREPKILFDCEDIACAHAGWLAAQCHEGIHIGLIVGRRISHCILGVQQFADPENPIQIVDPSRWFGMGPTSYANPLWKKLVLDDMSRRARSK